MLILGVLLGIIAFLLSAAFIIAGLFIFRTYRAWQGIKSDFSDFFLIPDKEGRTQFSMHLSTVMDASAARIRESVMAGIAGSFGGMTKGINAELAQTEMAFNPGAAVVKQLPKSIRKHKLLANIIESLVEQAVSKGISDHGDNGTFQLPTQGGLKI